MADGVCRAGGPGGRGAVVSRAESERVCRPGERSPRCEDGPRGPGGGRAVEPRLLGGSPDAPHPAAGLPCAPATPCGHMQRGVHHSAAHAGDVIRNLSLAVAALGRRLRRRGPARYKDGSLPPAPQIHPSCAISSPPSAHFSAVQRRRSRAAHDNACGRYPDDNPVIGAHALGPRWLSSTRTCLEFSPTLAGRHADLPPVFCSQGVPIGYTAIMLALMASMGGVRLLRLFWIRTPS